MKKSVLTSCFLGFILTGFCQKPLKKNFDLSTLNDSSYIIKYIYDKKYKKGYAIHKDNFVTTNHSYFDSEGFSLLIQGYFLKPNFRLNLKKISEDLEEYLDIDINELNKFYVNIIYLQLDTYIKDAEIRKKIKDDLKNGLLKYNSKLKSFNYLISYKIYNEISISIKETDSFTTTTTILLVGNK